MEREELYRLWDRFEVSRASELVYEEGNLRFALKKGSGSQEERSLFTAAPKAAGGVCESKEAAHEVKEAAHEVQETEAALEMQKAGGKPVLKEAALHAVVSPLVGTFYRSPAPGEECFVRLGQKVASGDVIGIVEAMKMMNEIRADQDGIVAEICAEDGDLVEFGQNLLLLKTEGSGQE